MSPKKPSLITKFLGIVYSPEHPFALLRFEMDDGNRLALPLNTDSFHSLRAALDTLPTTVGGRSRPAEDESE